MPDTDLYEQVLDRLGSAVVGGEIAPGEALRIEQLAVVYGVSRSVIREAVRVMESMNLMSSRRRVGVTVLAADRWNVFDPRMIRWRLAGPARLGQLRSLSELRSGVEPVAAALAAMHATPEDCGELTRAVIGMSVSGKAGRPRNLLAARHSLPPGGATRLRQRDVRKSRRRCRRGACRTDTPPSDARTPESGGDSVAHCRR